MSGKAMILISPSTKGTIMRMGHLFCCVISWVVQFIRLYNYIYFQVLYMSIQVGCQGSEDLKKNKVPIKFKEVEEMFLETIKDKREFVYRLD